MTGAVTAMPAVAVFSPAAVEQRFLTIRNRPCLCRCQPDAMMAQVIAHMSRLSYGLGPEEDGANDIARPRNPEEQCLLAVDWSPPFRTGDRLDKIGRDIVPAAQSCHRDPRFKAFAVGRIHNKPQAGLSNAVDACRVAVFNQVTAHFGKR